MPGTEIKILLQRFADDQLDGNQLLRLQQLMQEDEVMPEVDQFLKNAYSNPSFSVKGDYERTKIYQEIKERLQLSSVNIAGKTGAERSGRLYYRLSAVAAIVVFGWLGYYFLMKPEKITEQSKVIVKNKDIQAPKSNLASITMADGTVIYLDSTANGKLAMQGGTALTKMANGEIAYNKEGASSPSALIYNTIQNPRASKVINIVLSDGSKVWLNAGSSLTYPVAFTTNERKVELTGEGYFEVAKDKMHPFIVHTKSMDIRVIGTAFNVRAYNDEKSAQTTLVRGVVEVTLKDSDKRILLKPKEKIVVKKNSQSLKIGNAPLPNILQNVTILKVKGSPINSEILETLWMKNNISFDNNRLQDIVPMLENWFRITIEVRDTSLLKKRFSGKIKNESLYDVLQLFSLTSGMRYKIEGENVTIYK